MGAGGGGMLAEPGLLAHAQGLAEQQRGGLHLERVVREQRLLVELDHPFERHLVDRGLRLVGVRGARRERQHQAHPAEQRPPTSR